MTISQNSLLGNVKRNTSNIFDQAADWTLAKYDRIVSGVERLARRRRKATLKKLEQTLEHVNDDANHSQEAQTPKPQLAERMKNYFNQKHFPRN